MKAFFLELLKVGIYKRNQGRITRQITGAVVALLVAVAAWRLSSEMLIAYHSLVRYGVSGLLLVVGLWAAYRLVNLPQFADFLIAVEAEMAKVSWPQRTELIRASAVVLLTIFALAAVLAGFDLVWLTVFRWIRIL